MVLQKGERRLMIPCDAMVIQNGGVVFKMKISFPGASNTAKEIEKFLDLKEFVTLVEVEKCILLME